MYIQPKKKLHKLSNELAKKEKTIDIDFRKGYVLKYMTV